MRWFFKLIKFLQFILLLALFVMSSLIKINPSFNPSAYSDMEYRFRSLYTPVWQDVLNNYSISYEINSNKFKSFVGLWELVGIVMLITNLHGIGRKFGGK